MPETGEVGIIRGAPYFLVPDVSTACTYYQEVLGFRCDYAAGDPPEFAIYSRSGFAIMFRQASAVRDPNGDVLGFGQEWPVQG